MAVNLSQVIIRPVITEKTTDLKEDHQQYTFRVESGATKGQIAQAVQSLFHVRVLKVRTQNVLGKFRRMGRFEGNKPDWKKAIVKIAKDQKIDWEKA